MEPCGWTAARSTGTTPCGVALPGRGSSREAPRAGTLLPPRRGSRWTGTHPPAREARARSVGAGLWVGQIWSDNADQSAVTRVFSILSVHREKSVLEYAEPGSEGYVYCQPLTTSASGGRNDSDLDPFFAEVDAFPPFGSRYTLVTYNPDWPSASPTSVLTPAGTFRKDRGGTYHWTDKDGQNHEATEYNAESFGELSRRVHQLIYGTAGPESREGTARPGGTEPWTIV